MITLMNGDCYELIKQIPDKSIDLIYIDIPYLYCNNGDGNSKLAKRITSKKKELKNISNGIDYTLLDELCKKQQYTYIYIYGVAKCKYWIY